MMKKFVSIVFALLAATTMMAQGVRVTTANGVLEGTDESGVKVFRGVAYAQPPVGDLRWKEPQPVENWQGVRSAKEYGPNPMQQRVFGDMAFGTKEMSEDCLYLNIWTPSKTMNEKLPVLIYFNGGGLYAGSGSEPRYAGDHMARKGGIISITANYRLGIFGFFAHPELTKENSYKGSGNYGYLDQHAAIKWVHDNIAAFGGDPEQITIVGESAGSMSVSAQMASPLNKGLFARAMASSGTVLGFAPIRTLKEAEDGGVQRMKDLGCKNLAQLRAMPAAELLEKANFRDSRNYNIDNYFFVEQPYETFKNNRQMQVPLLVGGNSEERSLMSYLRGKEATLENVRQVCRDTWGDKGDAMFEAYHFESADDLKGEKGAFLASDLFLSYTTWKLGNMHKKSGQPVYRYMYCRVRPDMRIKGYEAALAGGVVEKKSDAPARPKAFGAVHSADIEYAMGTLPTNRVFDWQPEDFTVSEIFSSYYVNFVKTGNPNGLGLTDWQPINGAEVEPALQIDVNTYMRANKELEDRYATFDRLFYGE